MNTTPTRKRTHLKSNQIAILQESFANNPLPDSSVRSKLAKDLAVTERTIQIWFQNRRAKARKIESFTNLKLNYDNQTNNTPRYQATFRTMMTPERFEELKHPQIRKRPRSISKPEPKSSHLLSNITMRAMSEGLYPMTYPIKQEDVFSIPPNENNHQLIPLPTNVIRIGSWTRFANIIPNSQQNDWDLICYCDPSNKEFIWKIQAEEHQFRIQTQFQEVQEIRLSQQFQLETGDLVGQIEFQLVTSPLNFSMWRFGQDTDWVRCGDFTENKQASLNKIHILQGNHESFKQSLLDLISLVPELASKITVIPSTTHNLITPTLDTSITTISPSSTPEPSQPVVYQQQLKNNAMSNLMLQAPFFYNNHQYYQSPQGEQLYQLMFQQQQQQMNTTSDLFNPSSSSSSPPLLL